MNYPICHFFHLNKCQKGKFCKFLHEPSIPLGYCPNGDSCKVSHDFKTWQDINVSQNKQSDENFDLHTKEIEVENLDEQNDEIIIINVNEFSMKFHEFSKILCEIIPKKENIQAKLNLDLMFIVDCTGSMGAWIEASKRELSTIINHIQDEFHLSEIRVSFVGYRDFSDGKKQFSIHDFSSNIDEIKIFIGKQKAIGGGDLAENVIGGLSYGLQQSWQSSAKYAVLICDAPSHGSTYYKGKIDDKFPEGDPEGRKLEDLIIQYARNGIMFYAIKIHEITDKMYSIMNEVYQKECGRKINVANLGNSTKTFGFFLASSLSKTITETSIIGDLKGMNEILNNLKVSELEKSIYSISSLSFDKIDIESENQSFSIEKNKDDKDFLYFEYDGNCPDWDKFKNESNFKAICHSWFIVKDINISINWAKPLIQKSQISTTVWINEKPFSSGSMRFAFYMKDVDLNQNLVAKIPKKIDKFYNLDYMMKDIESLFICNHIINEFNDRIISLLPDENMIMNFVHGFIYEIIDEKFPFKYWWVENYIEGTYEKFNNNAGWESKNLKQNSLIAHALSHFSWQYTKGYLMIVDLQGGCGTLTDPQIHCIDKKRFGKGNLGIIGMMKFFLSHSCNFYCQNLNLINPKNNENQETIQPILREFFQNSLKKPNNNDIINKLCDLCRKTYQIPSENYYYSRKKYPELYCKNCEFAKSHNMKEAVCCESDCHKTYKYSVFWFKMKRTDPPTRCSQCRLKNRNKMRKELAELN